MISILPSSIGQLTGLERLFLAHNLISILPSSIGQLTGLEHLSFDHNMISILPSPIGQLTGLEDLSLHNNMISILPSSIGQLTGLKDLNFAHNMISILPSPIRQLTGLKDLNLNHNMISTLPSSIGQLTDLTYLLLANNMISILPSWFGQLTNLKNLWLDNNTLTTIPASILTTPRSASSPDLRGRTLRDCDYTTPGWCVGSTAVDLTLLGLVLIVEAALFAFHCTSVLDVMVDRRDTASWVGITFAVKVVAGLLLVPAMLLALWFIISTTCLRQFALRRARRTNETRDVLTAKSLFMTLLNYVFYVTSPASSDFFLVMFLLEVKESIVQALAVDQMSRAGIGRVALTLYTSVMLLNGVAPVVIAWTIRHINRIDDAKVRRTEASRWIARLLLFDATCDLLYSFFALGHLLFRYYFIFGSGGDSEEARIADKFAAETQQSSSTLKGYMLMSEAQSTFFGGTSTADTVIKFLSRVLPLLQAPLRVGLAFTIRQNVAAGSCVVPAYPIFYAYADETGWGCRSCACNTLLYASNCTALATVNGPTATIAGNSSTILAARGCHAPQHREAELPSTIAKLTRLQQLFLDDNLFSSISSSIGQLTGLEGLHLERNLISILPSFIGQLTGLEDLRLENNMISILPSPIVVQLTGLEQLHLHHNMISTLPSSIGQLTGLEELRLQNNMISILPSSIGQLIGLENLRLQNNMISTLPSCIGQLIALTHLRLDNNMILTLPSSIGQLTNLKELWLDNNTLTTIPASILTTPRSASSPNLRVKSFLENGNCNPKCDTAACGWDGGDCLA
eukprot:g2868.t1